MGKEQAVERAKMEAAVTKAVVNWAHLENGLAKLLSEILYTRKEIAFAVYYSPSNTETRISIVDNVVFHFSSSSYPKLVPTFKLAWDKLKLRIDRAKATRNKIVHGNITFIHMNNANYVRLTHPIFDTTKRNILKWDQVPGMSSHDVEAAATKFLAHSESIRMLKESAVLMSRNFTQENKAKIDVALGAVLGTAKSKTGEA